MEEFMYFWEVFFWEFLDVTLPGLKSLVMDVILPSKAIGAFTIILSGFLGYQLYRSYQARVALVSDYKESRARLYDAITSAHYEKRMEVNKLKETIKNLIDELTKSIQPDEIPDDLQEDLKTLSLRIVLPATATDCYLKGYSCLIEKNYKDASEHFNGSIGRIAAHYASEITDADQKIQRVSAGAKYGLGFAYQKLAQQNQNASKNYKQAIKNYKEATPFLSGHKNAYFNMGYSQYALERHDEAINSFESGSDIETRNVEKLAEVHNHIGLSHKAQNEKIEAIISYQKATKLKPEFADAYYNMGHTYVSLGDIDDAELNINKAAYFYQSNNKGK